MRRFDIPVRGELVSRELLGEEQGLGMLDMVGPWVLEYYHGHVPLGRRGEH